ncbi:MAG: B12-binding domain-containing radical SAM protein [Nitrospinae bacterium]|nr:B12-binding domain-containing radical SAM protein [Nitrospinota bacterium]
MRLLLISPSEQDIYMKHSAKEARSFWFARLSLTMIAALTPPDVDVSIVDENLDDIDFEDNVDLVGITVMTAHAPRAYEISTRFRARGIKVVLGGIHPSVMSEEAIQHADAVVIGEAEDVWASLIEDFKRGGMKRFYKSSKPSDLVDLPIPRRYLLNKDAYNISSTVQTTRGCPFSCDFCSVTEFFGKRYRQRPIDEVIHEIEGIDDNFIAFVDDNIIGKPMYAKELFRRLAPLKFKWGGQASITMTHDLELMRLARESGCVGMYVGLESLSIESLAGVGKTFNNVDRYEEVIKRFHDNGIMVIASIIFGFDSDNEGIFEKTVRFLEKNKVEMATFYILTPLPGTVWANRLKSENRIISYDWSKYNGGHVLFKPKLMSLETLSEGYRWAYHHFYSIHTFSDKKAVAPPWQDTPKVPAKLGF